MVKGDPTMIFSVVLTKRAVAVRQEGVSQCHRVQLLAIIAYGSMVGPGFLSEYPKGITLLFLYEKGKRESENWDAQGQMGSSNSPIRP